MATRLRIEEFMAEHQAADTTRESYGRHLLYLDRWLAEHDLSLPAMEFKDFLAFIADRGWGSAAARQNQSAARRYLRWAGVRDHALQEHSVRREEPDEQFTLSVDGLKQLLACGSMSSHKYRRNLAMVLTAFHGALRSRELVALRLKDLDFERERMFIVAGKQGRKEQAPFPADGLFAGPQPWVRQWLDDVRPRYARKDVDAVFVGICGSTPGRRMYSRGWGSICSAWGARAGLPEFSPHALRRGFATWMLELGMSTEVVMKAGRWQSYSSFRRYTQAIGVDTFLDAFKELRTNGHKSKR